MTLHGFALLTVVFGLVLAALDLAFVAMAPLLLARLGKVPAARRPGAILLARFAPVLIALLVTFLSVAPAWWRFEPADAGEVVSLPLLFLAGLALLPLLQGVHRGARMFAKTRDRLLFWRGRGRRAGVEAPFEVVEVRSADLGLSVGGYLKPTIYASREVMTSLQPEELSAALAHEVSHASARDPLRLLGMASCPDFLQLLGLDREWRRAFQTACEFAADADATRGDPETALDLASALLKVARLRSPKPLNTEPLADMAVSSAFSSRLDLEARVSALANPAPPSPVRKPVLRPWMYAAIVFGLGAASIPAWEGIHILTEQVGRFLAP
jgi:hypothetical protein